ncbi:glycoside hydrolase family 5 protein [Ruminococcus albus]|nr:glycoside hydrolase family 5 protein [Ruminococcus albus]
MLKKIISGLTAAASACTIVLAPVSGIAEKSAAIITASAATPDSYHDDWLHVNENAEVVDMNGNPVWMTGVNWFGYNVGSQVFDGVWSINMHQALNEIADHGFNLLRVPMSTEILLQWKNGKPDPIIKINEWKNPELTIDGQVGGKPMYSFDIWNKAVEWCRENGIKIMMDIHCATTNAAGHNYALWYDDKYSEQDWLDALAWFSDYYKDDDTVIAIDLKNEPHGKKDDGIFAKWDGSKDANNWRYAAEKGAKACLDKNPNLLIMVEGIECYPKFEKGFDWNSNSTDYAHYGDPDYQPYHGAWWGGNFRGARDYPVNLGKYQSQLVYSPHDYGPLVYEQSWFHLQGKGPNYTSYKFDRESLLKEYWYDSWAFLVEEKISPLLMGEWGGRIDKENDPSGANKHWMEELRDYMIEKRIHHTFWCFNENSSDTGGLIASDCNWDHWDEEKYEFVKPSLWQDEKGKFISLDHKIKLGQSGNGISLSDYYSTSHSDPDPDPKPQNNDYPKNIKVNYSAQYHQVQFMWDKVQGADKYGIAVYLAGKWRVQTSNITTNNYVTPKNLTPGMTYKVAVAARVNGKWNTTDPIKNAITVTIK